MIIDTIKNIHNYDRIGERLARALSFIASIDETKIETGRHEIDGDDIYAVINNYFTKSRAEANPEAHRKYADVQYVVFGSELLGYAPASNQSVIKEYDQKRDIEFFDAEVSFNKLEAGMFAIVFPNELHTPGICIESPVPVKKIVVKVRM